MYQVVFVSALLVYSGKFLFFAVFVFLHILQETTGILCNTRVADKTFIDEHRRIMYMMMICYEHECNLVVMQQTLIVHIYNAVWFDII